MVAQRQQLLPLLKGKGVDDLALVDVDVDVDVDVETDLDGAVAVVADPGSGDTPVLG